MKWILIAALLITSNTLYAADKENPNIFVPPSQPIPDEPVNAKVESKGSAKGAIITPKVTFENLKDGQTVKTKFKAKFKIEGMKIKPAGTLDVGTGHHHVIVDGAAIPKGQVVPKDEKNLHYGKGETSAELNLTPGSHKLTLQFADGNHLSYGPELSQTITVKVE